MIIFIPGAIIAAATFPGVILHEMAHKFFCDRYHVPVYAIQYFAASKNAGHVLHAPVNDSRKNAIIGFAPLLINSTVCFLLLMPTVLPILAGTSFVSSYRLQDIFLIWVGLSCGLNALPSKADLAHIDKNVSWLFICLKRLAQVLNYAGFVGGIIWLLILFIVPFLMISLPILLIVKIFF